MENETIKIGLIGVGRAGYGMHLPEVLATDGKFDFAAVCDIDPARRDVFEKRLGHPVKFYSDVSALLQDPDVEMVSVATPSNFHTPHAIAALNAGKYVFIEKPIATSYAEALNLAKVAGQYPGKLFLRHNRRFSVEISKFREIIDSGILGEIFEIRFRIMNYDRRADWQAITECGGGLLNNWGPHLIEHALYFLDAPVKRSFSRLCKVAAAGNAEDHFNIILEGTNSRLIDIEVSGGCALSEPMYSFYGSRGACSCNDRRTIHLKYLDPGQPLAPLTAVADTPPLDASFGQSEKLRWIEKEVIAERPAGNGCAIWQCLYDSIRFGKAYPITIEQGLEVVKIIDTAKRGTQFEQTFKR
ncbi:MAG: putative oxidoreductase YvaA [Lentisphaerae bacterium ADurb.Bin242]|nr:MAG: putative oxidoreductase YvaA [Lentisphaerae bacterium ADurb.Bin242]